MWSFPYNEHREQGLTVWLDDRRPMPEGYDIWCKAGEDLVQLFEHDCVRAVSMDHDLGQGIDGTEVVKRIRELAHEGRFSSPITFRVHTGNPPAGLRMCKDLLTMQQQTWPDIDWPRIPYTPED